jgi:hypothetical protein
VTSSRGCSSKPAGIAASLLLGLCATAVSAAQVDVATASYDYDVYHVEVDARVDAPLADVRRLLTDYNHLGRINPSIEVSEILLQRNPDDCRVRTVTKVCVWFYCKHIHQVQDVTEGTDGTVTAIVLPGQSDFRYGYAHVHTWAENGGTRVLIRGDLQPDFWIPPLIGPWMIKRKLIDEALETIDNLERVAPREALPHNSATLKIP